MQYTIEQNLAISRTETESEQSIYISSIEGIQIKCLIEETC